jgi:hypothetical protein
MELEIDVMEHNFGADPSGAFLGLEARYLVQRRWDDLLDVYDTRRAGFEDHSEFWRWVGDRLTRASMVSEDPELHREIAVAVGQLRSTWAL